MRALCGPDSAADQGHFIPRRPSFFSFIEIGRPLPLCEVTQTENSTYIKLLATRSLDYLRVTGSGFLERDIAAECRGGDGPLSHRNSQTDKYLYR